MPITSAIDRMPANKRNEAMERISHRAVRLRGRGSLTALGRVDSCEQLIVRLGVIPIFLYGTPGSGVGVLGAESPASGSVTVTQADASTPATNTFNKGDPAVSHTFTAAGVKQVVTATFSGNSNAKGRAAATL